MNNALATNPNAQSNANSKRLLTLSAQMWFLVAVIGQWLFVAYIVLHYLGLALDGSPAALKSFGIHAGDLIGNVSMILHITFAAIIIGGGPLQLLPTIRARAPRFHRWNGRVYIAASLLTALGGFYLVWTRDIPGGLMMRLGVSFDAVLIFLFAVLALRHAIAGNIKTHRRWALRLFMVVSAVWFYRIAMMGWIVANQGPAGFDPQTMQGPAIYFINFAQTLVPLAILELYFRAQDTVNSGFKSSVALLIFIATILTAFGIFAATVGMWLPELSAESSYWRN